MVAVTVVHDIADRVGNAAKKDDRPEPLLEKNQDNPDQKKESWLDKTLNDTGVRFPAAGQIDLEEKWVSITGIKTVSGEVESRRIAFQVSSMLKAHVKKPGNIDIPGYVMRPDRGIPVGSVNVYQTAPV